MRVVHGAVYHGPLNLEVRPAVKDNLFERPVYVPEKWEPVRGAKAEQAARIPSRFTQGHAIYRQYHV